MEESIAGFKERGSWGDVVEHGERITQALRELGIESDAFAEWEEWRPKPHERLNKDVNKKTAKQASVNEGEGEKKGKNVGDDLKTAGEKLTESYEKVENGDNDGAIKRWEETIDYVARAADSASRKAIRKVENTVYQNVMTQLAPYYFDNELVSANIQKTNRGPTNDEQYFIFEVNINDDTLKTQVSELLGEYEASIDRWHVTTEKETANIEAAEGVEPPIEPKQDDQSKFTIN